MIEAQRLQSFQIVADDFRLNAAARSQTQRREAVKANRRQLSRRGGGEDQRARGDEKAETHGIYTNPKR
jgi:hypothetical protein